MATGNNPPFISAFEAFNILKEHKSITNDAIRAIFSKCNVPSNKATISRFQRKFKKVVAARKKAICLRKLNEWSVDAKNENFCTYLPQENEDVNREESSSDSDYLPNYSQSDMHSSTKKPLTSKLSRSAISKRVKAIIPSLQSIADSENTSLVQLLIIVLVHICTNLRWTTLAKLLYTVFISMTDIEQQNEMNIEKSAYVLVSQELGRDRYHNLRNTLVSEGLSAQPWYKVNAHCNTITPPRIPVTINAEDGVVGYRFSFKDACKYIVNRNLLAAKITAETVPDEIYIAGKDGTDGSGQHYRRAQVNVAVKGNIILYSFTPLYICAGNTATGKVIWRNTAPNSALTQRPLAVIGAKEDRDDILRPLIPQIESEISDISSGGFRMSFMDKDIHVTVNSCLTMIDGKMHASLQGTGGAYCLMCKFSKDSCHNVEYVANGFPVDRSIEDMHIIYSMVSNDGESAVIKKQGDYGTRAGVTAEPITHRELNTALSNTHAWICFGTWFLNILYHVIANDKTWGFGNKADRRHKSLMKAKAKAQDTFAQVLGIKIDAADATGHSGNSLNGPIAKRFFSEKCRALLDQLVKPQYLDVIKTLHIRLEVILRIISTKDHKIDINAFRDLCKNTYLDILIHLKWVVLTPTVHKVLAHAPELIERNMCMGLGHLSEEGLEACNKIMRRIRTHWTLQKDDDSNLKDLLRKMWLISDPVFYSFRKVLKCPKCGSLGHQKKCPTLQQETNQSESDLMVQELFVD